MKIKKNLTCSGLVAVLILICASIVYGDGASFCVGPWSIPPGFDSEPTTKLRDGTDVSHGLIVSGARTSNSISFPPTTNSVDNYTDRPAGEFKNVISDGMTVEKNGKTGFPVPEDGEYLYEVNGNSGENGYARVYSASNSIPEAAYYANTQVVAFDDGSSWHSGGGITISNVNPAYVIPFISLPTAIVEIVEGTVYSSLSGGNNQLESGIILVEYLLEGETNWQELASNINSDGSFSGTVGSPSYPVNVYIRARVKDEFTLRNGFPISSEIFIENIIPEPGVLAIIMLAGLAFFRRK